MPLAPGKVLVNPEFIDVNRLPSILKSWDVLVAPEPDPYEAGWMVIISPEDWDAVKAGLVSGADVAAPYEAKMAADGFDGCG